MAEQKNIMSYETVALDDEQSALVILDQTKLPYEVEVLHLTEQKDIWAAGVQVLLAQQGITLAELDGVYLAGGFGVYLAAKQIQADNYDEFYAQFKKAKEYLDSSRPTAVNLSWALNRMEKVVTDNKDKSIPEIKELLHKECVAIKDEDVWMCRQIGEYGLSLIKDGDGILTHCNAGQLATSKYGTALAPIHLGRERGMNFRVFTDETRPLLQGARLSAFELQADGVDTTVICDNMASQVMKNGWVQACFVGCDRVAVILTKPVTLERNNKRDEKLARLLRHKYPKAAEGLALRAERYNAAVRQAQALEEAGRACIIAPDSTEGMATLTKDKGSIEKMYEKGRADAEKLIRWKR